MSLEDFNLHEWQKEKFDAMIVYEKEQQIIETNTINTIKEMLKNDASVDFISKVTKKTEEEILKIKNSII